ncbi:MAG: hypothetical protein QGG36_25115 [Pirellulaceae bacterium]|jgi:hypothetical protein|nr:hypothetical protein [Pirellulaceae bacterium]MDP7019102.1 hypothetical protein [Pirellulaceae bacterium]
MARKTQSIKAAREEAEAAEAAKAAAPKKKAKAKRKSRAKKSEPVEVRRKLFWGVFNQSLKRVALYEHNQKKQAEDKAKVLSKDGKTPHFVQKVKEVVEE